MTRYLVILRVPVGAVEDVRSYVNGVVPNTLGEGVPFGETPEGVEVARYFDLPWRASYVGQLIAEAAIFGVSYWFRGRAPEGEPTAKSMVSAAATLGERRLEFDEVV